MKELELEHVADVKIGGELKRGILGGEKQRISIGVDLVHNPAVLLDEPTSGLDSASAFHIASLLKSDFVISKWSCSSSWIHTSSSPVA